MACKQDEQSTFGVSIFYFFAICVIALILLCIGAAIFGPQVAESAQKLHMTNPVGLWCWVDSQALNPFTLEWIQGPWWLFFLYI